VHHLPDESHHRPLTSSTNYGMYIAQSNLVKAASNPRVSVPIAYLTVGKLFHTDRPFRRRGIGTFNMPLCLEPARVSPSQTGPRSVQLLWHNAAETDRHTD